MCFAMDCDDQLGFEGAASWSQIMGLPAAQDGKKRRALSPPSHVIFSKALMDATRRRPKAADLEEMYSFPLGQLEVSKPKLGDQLPRPVPKPEKVERRPRSASWAGGQQRMVWKQKGEKPRPAQFRRGGC